MRDSRKRSATKPGRKVFIAHVMCSAPVVPNFIAAMKITFGASGNSASALRSSRSARMVSIPARSKRSITLWSE